MLKIDRNMTYQAFAVFEPYMSEADVERVKSLAVRVKYGEDGFWSMPVGDMLDAMRGNVARLTWGDSPDSAFAVLRVRAFSEWVGGFIAKLQAMTLPPTPEQLKSQSGTLTCTFEEAVYMFLRQWFGLRGFAEADRLKVADLLLARKEAYNAAIVERNLANSIRKGQRK